MQSSGAAQWALSSGAVSVCSGACVRALWQAIRRVQFRDPILRKGRFLSAFFDFQLKEVRGSALYTITTWQL